MVVLRNERGATLSVETFLGDPLFKYGVFPIISAGTGILLKCVSRHDSYAFFKKEDVAVGPSLMLTAALSFVVLTTDRARALTALNNEISTRISVQPIDQVNLLHLQRQAASISSEVVGAGWTLFLLIILLWATTSVVKRWGWKSETEMNAFVGISIPLFLGVLSLMYVMQAATL